MVTVETIRVDLDEIRYYYGNQQELDIAANSIGECSASVKAKRYNRAITHAPVVLYKLYMALYVNGLTQLDYALEIDRAAVSVYRSNRKLYEFFVSYFNKNENV